MKKIAVLEIKKPISIEIDVQGRESEKEIQKIIIEAAIKKMQEKFPAYYYSISTADTLTFETAKVGYFVEDTTEKDLYGVILSVNRKSITVVTKKGAFNGNPTIYKKADIDIEKAMWVRLPSYKEANVWSKGDVGFLAVKTQEGVKIEKIIITKEKNNNYQLYRINGTSYYTLPEDRVRKQLFDTKEEAERFAFEKLGAKEYGQTVQGFMANIKKESEDILFTLTAECTKMRDWCRNSGKFTENLPFQDWENNMCIVYPHAIMGGDKNIAIKISYKKTKSAKYYRNQEEFKTADEAIKFILENKLDQ